MPTLIGSLIRHKRTITDPVPPAIEAGFAGADITAFHGAAHSTGRNMLQVGNDMLTGQYVVIATGAMPAKLKMSGAEHLVNSTQFVSDSAR